MEKKIFSRMLLKFGTILLILSLFNSISRAQCSGVGVNWTINPPPNTTQIIQGCTPVTFNYEVCNYSDETVFVTINITATGGLNFLDLREFQLCGTSGISQVICTPAIAIEPFECRNLSFIVQSLSDLNRIGSTISVNGGICSEFLGIRNIIASGFPVVGQTGQTTLLSQVPDLSPNTNRLLLKGNVIFDMDFTFPSNSLIAMDEDAKITIPSGKILTLFESRIQGCVRLWNSITVENGGEIFTFKNPASSQRCEIRDAENAIIGGEGSLLSLNATNFINNRIGINAKAEFPYTPIELTPLWECSFFGTGKLLPPAGSVENTPQNAYPYAGINVENFENVVIDGGNGTRSAIFQDMANGIVSKNSSLDVSGAIFKNILFTNGASNDQIRGNGIYATGDGGTYVGLVVDQTSRFSKNEFTNCYNAINTSKIYWNEFRDNVIKNTVNPYYSGIISSNNQGFFDISRNEVIANIGVLTSGTSLWSGQEWNWIRDNQLQSQSFSFGGGLLCNENMSNYGWNIKNNTVSGNSLLGYYLLGVNNSSVTSNDAATDGVTYSDFIVSGTQNLNMTCNTASSINGRGITIFNTPFAKLNCNSTNSTTYGLFVDGACTNAEIKGNQFSGHSYGLYYNTSTQTGAQNHAGNRWLNSASIFDATHAGGVFEADFSPYIVSSAVPPLKPSTISPTGWFQIESSGTPFSCTATPDCPNIFSLASPPNSVTGIDPLRKFLMQKKGDSKLQTRGENGVSAEMTWTMQYHLYRHLAKKPEEMVKDKSLKDFFQSMANSNIAKFYKVENVFDKARTSAETQKKALAKNLLKLDSLRAQYIALDTFETVRLSKKEKDKSNNGKKMNIIRDEIKKIRLDDDIKFKQIKKTEKEILKGGIQSEIASIEGSLQPEINEKAISEIYYDVYLNDKTLLDEKQKNIVKDIAHQCPKIGGDAVFKARALYQMIEQKVFIDDDKLCNNSVDLASARTDLLQKPVNAEPVFSVSPNPVADIINLRITNSGEKEGEWLIFDAFGKTLIRCQQPNGNLDVSHLPTGIYFVTYRNKDLELFKSKFVKIK